jgi:hypothetical protein
MLYAKCSNGRVTNGMSYGPETPFGDIESAEQFLELLIKAIDESRRDVDADIALAEVNRSGHSKQALQLVSDNLAKLSQRMTASCRILNYLRTLRQLLLQKRRLDNTLRRRNGSRKLSRWS